MQLVKIVVMCEDDASGSRCGLEKVWVWGCAETGRTSGDNIVPKGDQSVNDLLLEILIGDEVGQGSPGL